MPADLLSLAFYLPQFHSIDENDRWWGEGFTEWTHMARAAAWYPGHVVRQPVEPLGRYNLLDTKTIEAQQLLASAHGIDGFLIWNYWLGGGQQLLERPVELMRSERLKVNYALAWANHDWVDKQQDRLLAEQRYPGEQDYIDHFFHCLPHFRSDTYVRIDGKPFFFIYRPEHVPDLPLFVQTWRKLAHQHGLPGLHIVGDVLKQASTPPPCLDGYSCGSGFWDPGKLRNLDFIRHKISSRLGLPASPPRFDFTRLMSHATPANADDHFVPTVFTGWDTTPRHGRNGIIVDGLTVKAFRNHLEHTQAQVLRQAGSTRVVLVKSWNEWAEGNLLEPDSVFGDALLREYQRFAASTRQALTREN
ncbi:MAG: glycoside hydrolase family 99-like domain-containing protein [Ideonella sp.]